MKPPMAFGCVLAALLAGLASVDIALAEDGPPRLVVESREASFGQAPPSKTVEVRFVLRNAGGAPLMVHPDLGPPLGLSSVPQSIPPGGHGELVVQVDLRRQQGMVAFPVGLTTNDPAQPQLALQVTGEVVEYVTSHPGYARWSVTQGEVDGTIPQTLRATDGEPFEVVSVELPHPGLREETTATEDGSWMVELTLDRRAPIGAISGEVVVHTTHPRQDEVRIPVSGFVRPMMAVTPYEIKGEAELETDGVEVLLVRVFATEPFSIAAVEHDLPGVPEAEIVEVEAGRTYQVLLHLPADLPKGRLLGALRIIPASDRAEPLVVPVDAVIR
ncbi:MAG TPA: hypothetical protein VLF66_12975 [Thermoanaerobaculia bacterium]|nr:hypothetical protein [Thermoanaerobaculia bacterium]